MVACQNFAGSWGRNFVGSWFVTFKCKTIHDFVKHSWGQTFFGTELVTHGIHEH